MTVASRDLIAMSQAPVTPENATCSDRGRRADRCAMSDAPLRMAHLRARAITIRFPRTPVTYILSATSPIERQRRCSLYSLHSRAICEGPVRSGVDRAPHVLVETLAIIGLVPFSETLSCLTQREVSGGLKSRAPKAAVTCGSREL